MEETQPHVRPRRGSAERRSADARHAPRIGWRRGIAVGVLLLLGVGLVGGLLLWQRLARFNDEVSTAAAFSSKLFGALRGDERVNVVLFGHSPEGRDGAFLSDSIAVLSVDPITETTTTIAIPRDLWIEGHQDLPGNGKVNEAFAVGYRQGGFPEAGARGMRLIRHVTGLDFDGWIALDFDGFRQMVDAVGGVAILNPTSFQWALGAEDHAAGVWAGTFPAGEISLDGYDALQYSRVRYTSVPAESSDFARSARQQRLLSAVRSRIEINPAGLQRGLALLDALEGGRFHTDLSVIDLMLLAPHLQTDGRVELAEGEILEATTNSAGQYVLVVIGRSAADDLSPLRAFIAARIDEAVP